LASLERDMPLFANLHVVRAIIFHSNFITNLGSVVLTSANIHFQEKNLFFNAKSSLLYHS
jgi:hypothetical protein